MKITMFPCKYHQNGGFSMAMLVLGRVYIYISYIYLLMAKDNFPTQKKKQPLVSQGSCMIQL